MSIPGQAGQSQDGTEYLPRWKISQSSLITELFGLEGIFTDHLVQPPAMRRDIFNEIRLLSSLSNLTLTVSRDGRSTTSLGNWFQCSTTLIIIIFFLIPNLNVLSFSLKPFPPVLSQQALLKKSVSKCGSQVPEAGEKEAVE